MVLRVASVASVLTLILVAGAAVAQGQTAEQRRATALQERDAARASLEAVRARREQDALAAAGAAARAATTDDAAAVAELTARTSAVTDCGRPGSDENWISRRWEIFGDGGSNSSDCARELLEEAVTADQLRLAAEARGYFYGARARRQQTISDYGAGAVVLGGIGYGASGRVGSSTQSFWGYATLLTVLSSEWNALEPTRVLYDAAYAGMNLLSARYERLIVLQERLEDALALTAPVNCTDGSFWTPDLSRWGQGLSGNALTAATGDRVAYLAEMRRLQAICFELAAAQSDVSATSILGVDEGRWVDAYRRDLLALDAVITNRDNQLRFSPAEIFNVLPTVASRTIDAVLTGGEANRAVVTVQTQETLRGLMAPVSALDSPITAAAPAQAIAPAPALLTSASGSTLLQQQTPNLMQRAAEMEQWRRRLVEARAISEEIRALSAARRLAFTWNIEANAPEVRLEVIAPPPAPTPPA